MQTGARVLVVEDYPDEAQQFLEWLQAAGYKTERAEAMNDALAKAADFKPDVVLLDLQIPSLPGGLDEHLDHGFRTLDALLREKPFRPIVIITAHSDDRELMRRVLQRTRGGQFVFKDTANRRTEVIAAVAVALASPAYKASRIVEDFSALVDRNEEEHVYRRWMHEHWQVLLGPEYRACHSPYVVSSGAEIDILAIRHDHFADLWELKRPGAPVFGRYGQWMHHSGECASALGQLMEYYDLAEREDGQGRRSYAARRGIDVRLHRPRGFVVIGRYRNDEERERLRLENSFFAGISILTYDDVIERARELLHFLSLHQNGDRAT
ncbi:Shedu anti-phage system protein SduA domain-containing protein [Sorangium sp. So ce233]|uniref:Shedu anti-phage system protein SduA domain-containing protein n=1 Tax=Sorangium sp. So ce233 TaxID=3133290 RepID=UPI003F5EE62B